MTEPNVTPWIGPDGQIMRRLELHLTYTCPERCVFCSEEHRMARFKRFPVTWGRAATVLRQHAERGGDGVHFTGGEPTIHPRFLDILRLSKKLGMRTSIGTIGTMLSRPGFAEKVVPYLNEALFSLHGPDAATHDALARRTGSFDRVTEAIRRCVTQRPGFGAFINTVLTRENAEKLPQTIALADSLGAKLIVVSNTTPEGAGLDAYEDLAVPLNVLADVLPRSVSAAKTAVLRFFGVPMCLLGSHRALSNDLHWDPRVTVEWTAHPGSVKFDSLYSWAPNRKRVHVAECEGCTLRGVCMGVFDEYARKWPTTDLTPILG